MLRVVFGPAYVAAAPLVRWYGLAMLAVVLAVIVLNFQLARDRMGFVYLYAAGSIVELALVWVFHASMVQVVQIVLVANAVLFLAGFALAKLDLER